MAGGPTGEPVPVQETVNTEKLRAILLMGGVPWNELEDGVQQVRLKLLEERSKPGQPLIRNPEAWAAVVASRIAVDWHRGRARDMGLRERLSLLWSVRPPVEHPEEEVLLAQVVAEGLERLPAQQRQALVLRYYTDLTVRDIARLLDVPEGTVKSRLHHAVAALRTELLDVEGI
ncbi:RNA polymerase sigma factor [Streptomyces sp. NBC_00038]|uniref:RNA polymerase sigma factor n=1 Tax=Streptomyces sp. NBC_00038 TaxID=2903615 RepID=UPI00225BAF04|nr:sigma-70 family RNA polymerase sigma factor [Streptomyces sp. NBC_00038]MCX5558483.1 sigma-70 family RNA polymerase sigma factor [Streptomyces sp. NBC_00038]